MNPIIAPISTPSIVEMINCSTAWNNEKVPVTNAVTAILNEMKYLLHH